MTAIAGTNGKPGVINLSVFLKKKEKKEIEIILNKLKQKQL